MNEALERAPENIIQTGGSFFETFHIFLCKYKNNYSLTYRNNFLKNLHAQCNFCLLYNEKVLLTTNQVLSIVSRLSVKNNSDKVHFEQISIHH